MKFAHLADCHVGGWKEPELKNLGLQYFENAIDTCIKNNVAFVIISGDLFNTAIPEIQTIKETARILHKLKDHDISCYIIAGSHDYSPSGKTMLDVLEESGLVKNVMKFNNNQLKFTQDKTGTKFTGIYGRRGGLEVLDYDKLNKEPLEKEEGFKIFLFHTALEEFKPESLNAIDIQSYRSLPKNFNYYAGGHVHYIFQKQVPDYGLITYPGPIFPNSFKELEELKGGGFYIVDEKLNFEHIKIRLKEVVSLQIDVTDLTPDQAKDKILKELTQDLKDKIVTLRIFGKLKSGKPSEIGIKQLIEKIECFSLIKNTSKLISEEFEEQETLPTEIVNIEQVIIQQNSGKLLVLTKDKEEELTQKLILNLDKEKLEGEKNADYENRIIKDSLEILK